MACAGMDCAAVAYEEVEYGWSAAPTHVEAIRREPAEVAACWW